MGAPVRQWSKDLGFGRSSRYYNVMGRDLPSVTTVLSAIAKPALLGWVAKEERKAVTAAAWDLYDCQPPEKMSEESFLSTLERRLKGVKSRDRALNKARDIGTEVHAAVEWTLRNELGQLQDERPTLSDPAQWAYMAWEDWRKGVNLVPLQVEEPVWSLVHGYAGTMDILCEIDNPNATGRIVVLGDWKTGKALYAESDLQNAAYVHAAIEMGIADRPLQGMLVRLPKVTDDPAFEVKLLPQETQASRLKAFLATLELWKWLEREGAL